MTYLTVKALHIVFFVSWFAGLFYISRLFIYHREAEDRPEAERSVLHPQLALMSRRLWFGITWPAMVLTLVFGGVLAVLYGQWALPWIHLKLTLVALILAYHLQCHRLYRQVAKGHCTWNGQQLRFWNEVATLLLLATVFTASLKDGVFQSATLVGLLIAVVLLTTGILAYKRLRKS